MHARTTRQGGAHARAHTQADSHAIMCAPTHAHSHASMRAPTEADAFARTHGSMHSNFIPDFIHLTAQKYLVGLTFIKLPVNRNGEDQRHINKNNEN